MGLKILRLVATGEYVFYVGLRSYLALSLQMTFYEHF